MMLSLIMFSENVIGHSPVLFLSVSVIVLGIKRFELRQFIGKYWYKNTNPFYTVGVFINGSVQKRYRKRENIDRV